MMLRTWRLMAVISIAAVSICEPCWAALPEGKPNIVIIALDTLRADHLGCYGYSRPTTPNIDKLASQGVRFDRCYSPGSWTIPAFASLFTGVMPVVHGLTSPDKKLSDKLPTLAERLSAAGYFTGGIVSNPALSSKFGFGRGFAHYDDYSVYLEADLAALAADGSRSDRSHKELVTGETVVRQSQALFDAAKEAKKPVFMFVHFFDPHTNYMPAAAYRKWVGKNYRGTITGRDVETMQLAPPQGADLEELISLYDGEILYSDEQVGKLMAQIDAQLGSEKTLVILLSDHGEAFGEHGMLLHSHSTYLEEIRVPMIWRWQGAISPSSVVKSPVTLLDVPTTLRDLVKLDEMKHLQGDSLVDLVSDGGREPVRDAVFSQRAYRTGADEVAVIKGNLVFHGAFNRAPTDSSLRLSMFDISSDPREQANLLDARKTDAAEMKVMLMKFWSDGQVLNEKFGAVEFPVSGMDAKERREIEGLGYLQSAPHDSK